VAAPELSVVVPVRDGQAVLPALLDSLAAQEQPRERFEVVVVDSASRDASAEVAERRGARVVREPVPGRARARNAGAAVARGAALAFVDADCAAVPGWLGALARGLEERELAAGPVEIVTRTPPSALERFEARSRYDQEHAVRCGWAASANLAIRRDAFEALGGFDTAYRHVGEDVDLCVRAGRAGMAIAWCPDAVVRTNAERRLRDVLARGVRHGYAGVQHRRRLGEGRVEWRHPLPLVRGDWALRRFQRDVHAAPDPGARALLRYARLEYAARIAGSAWAALAEPRRGGRGGAA
jgi:glycosyltransferase involved in cell wall biosynthesis